MTEIKINELIKESAKLRAENAEIKADLDTAIKVTQDVLAILGLNPMPKEGEVMKVLIKQAGKLTMQMMTDQEGVIKKFAVLKKIKPLIEKYVKN